MIEDIAKRIVKSQIKRPYLMLGIIAIISLMLAPGLLGILNNIEPSLEKVLPENIEVIKVMNQMRSDFGADMIFLTIKTDSDIRQPVNIKFIKILEDRLKTQEHILEVNSIADLVISKYGSIPNSIYTIKELTDNEQTDIYVNYDKSITIMKIRSDTGSDADTIKKVVDSINADINSLESVNPGLEIKITGFNAIDKATFEVIMSDFQKITLISFLLISIIVYLTFRSLSKGLLPMIVVIFALLWTFSIVGYLQMTITVVSMVSAAMIMGLGIDFGIHIVHTFYENRKKESRNIAIESTMTELLRAMLAASLTTSAGFLALIFGVLPAMKTLGIILAIGIINTLLGATFVLPIFLILYDKKFGGKEK